MTAPLEILQITAQPWQWIPEIDGVPADDSRASPAANDPPRDAGQRHLSYAFASPSPDVVFDRVPVDLRKLGAVTAEIESSVYTMIGGQAGALEALKRAGEALCRLVMPAWITRRLFDLAPGSFLLIQPDELSEAIPFELCYDRTTDRFLCAHVAMARGVVGRRRGSWIQSRVAFAAAPVRLSSGCLALNPELDPSLSGLAREMGLLLDQLPPEIGQRLSLSSGAGLAEFLAMLGTPCFIYSGHIRVRPEAGSYIESNDRHYIHASEIRAHLKNGAPPALAVLNGCGGARVGPPAGAAAHASLTRIFYECGAQAAVGSRWEVDLRTAGALNRELLSNMTRPDSLPIGEWLRQFRGSGVLGWAGHVLYGDPRTIFRLTDASDQQPGERARRHADGRGILTDRKAKVLPTRRTPLFVGLAVELAEQDEEAVRKAERFLDVLLAEIRHLDARLAPHRAQSVCRLALVCHPIEVGETLRAYRPDWPWDSDESMPLKGVPSRSSIAGVNAAFRRLLENVTGELPSPVFVLLLDGAGWRRLIGGRGAGVASPEGIGRELLAEIGETGSHPWIVALDDQLPEAAMREWARGSEVRIVRMEEQAALRETVRSWFAVEDRGRGRRGG